MNPTLTMEIAEIKANQAVCKKLSPVGKAVLEGMESTPKFLPSWLFYDTVGSRLFEAITELPEYYLTRLEHSIFEKHADDMIAAAAGYQPTTEDLCVLELGAGSASKTLVLLRALMARQGHAIYLPVDVSRAALEWAAGNVRTALPAIQVKPICSEFTHEKKLALPEGGRRLALYIGSSIGNFDQEDAIQLLQWLSIQLQPGDALLLGTDMVKDSAPLLAAYNDRSGVTEKFNKNILARLNRELGADFSLDDFRHRAIWNESKGRMEMHLDSLRNQTVHIPELERSFQLRRDESIHTENCYKFSPDGVTELLRDGGFALEQSWYDEARWFGVHLARLVEDAAIPDAMDDLDDEPDEEAA